MTYLRQLVRNALVFLIAAALLESSSPAVERLSAEARGYRVREYRWDAVLLQRWAVLEDAAHPERPLLAELVQSSKAELQTAVLQAAQGLRPPVAIRNSVPVIHVGDQVTLWSEEGNVRLQLGAVAQQNAATGERIQLRVTGAGVNGSAGWQAAGIVRGPGNVEMER